LIFNHKRYRIGYSSFICHSKGPSMFS